MYLSSSNILQRDDNIHTKLKLPPFLNFDFNKSNCIMSPDNSFAIFYNDSIIINIDLKSKRVKWYKKVENNEKIYNVIINSNNQISFIKKLNTHNEIIILSNNNFMEYNELKVNENIVGYKLISGDNSSDLNEDIIIIVNDWFQISLYKDNILQKSISRNIINDIQNGLIKYNSQILNIEYINEQKLILFFFDNGIITVYSISDNININEVFLEYREYIDLNKGENNQYSYTYSNIHQNNYKCDYIINENNDLTTFLIICANKKAKNGRKSTVYFFKLENCKFIPIDEDENTLDKNISFDNKEIMDSYIFKYKINNDENDMSDYIFLLFKETNIFKNNNFLFLTEYSNLFNWFNLKKENDVKENNKFEVYEYLEENPTLHIFINNINLYQQKPKIFTISYIKMGENIINIENNKKNNIKEQSINDILNSNNYEDYISLFNSINFNEEEFNNGIKNKYQELYNINLEYDNINQDDIPKINYFLINLIANQSLFKIKNYLSKRNSLNSGFIFPIEQICVTSNFLLNSLKNEIKNEKKRNNEIEKLISIIINFSAFFSK